MKTIGILLGGGINDNQTIPHDILTRIHKTSELYTKEKIEAVIITGGKTNKKVAYSEAKIMAGIVKEKIKGLNIILEEKAMDTIGNAVYSKKIILKKKLPRNIILITSDYHMPRALSIFRHIFGKGYIITPAPSNPHFLHKFRMMFHEWEEKEIETLLLATVHAGDHKHAEKFIYETIEKYKNL